jgi:hypothetical protein
MPLAQQSVAAPRQWTWCCCWEQTVMAEHEDPNAKKPAARHNTSNRRFEINIDGQLSALEYAFKINPGSEA